MKTLKLLSILVVTALTIAPTPSHANNNPQTQTQLDLENIDLEIQLLNRQLEKRRKEASNQELEAQPYMRYHWQEFTEDIDHSENREKEVLDIKEKIQKLKAKKASLLKQSS